MLSTAPHSLAATAARLRSGILTADYAPHAVADLIESLARERREAASRVDELERAASPAGARNAYAQGWRNAIEAIIATLSYDDNRDALAEQLRALQPDFARAGLAAHEAAA